MFVLSLYLSCTGMPELEFNTPPQAGVVVLSPEAPDTLADIHWSFAEEPVDAEGDALTYRVVWRQDGALTQGMQELLPAARTQKGDVVEVEVIASDGEWESEPMLAQVEILNTPPVIEEASLDPAAARTEDTLQLRVDGSDVDDDSLVVRVAWTRDGSPVPDLDDALFVTADHTASGELWEATFTLDDGEALSEAQALSVRVDNTAPTVDRVVLQPELPTVEEAITASVVGGQDPDHDPLTRHVVWTVDGSEVEVDVLEGASTVATLDSPYARGQRIQVSAWVEDGALASDTVESGVVEVQNALPVVDAASLSASTVREGDTLSCLPGTGSDADGDALTWVYDWRLGDSSWSGQDQAAVTGDDFDRGDELQCRLAAHDGLEQGGWVESATLTVENTAPSVTSLALSDLSPTVLDSLTVTLESEDPDPGDSVSYSYSWLVNGSSVSSSASLTLSGNAERGDSVMVVVTPTDGSDSGAATSSAVVTVDNSPPSVSSVSVSPGSADTSDDLVATPSGGYDADGDTVSYTYSWEIDGSVVSTAGRELESSYTKKGDAVVIEVTPNDGTDLGSAVRSRTINIQNTNPSASMSVSDTSPESCDLITLDASASSDADSIDTLSYSWSLISQPSSSKADEGNFSDTQAESPEFQMDAEGTFIFKVSVSDGTAADTTTATVVSTLRTTNSDPVADGGSDSVVSETVACTSTSYGMVCPNCDGVEIDLDASGSSDGDGDPLSYSWSASALDGGSVSIADTTAETTTLEVSGLTAEFGAVLSYDVEVTLGVSDCAEGSDITTITYTVECEGY